jgi:hypothetical protein
MTSINSTSLLSYPTTFNSSSSHSAFTPIKKRHLEEEKTPPTQKEINSTGLSPLLKQLNPFQPLNLSEKNPCFRNYNDLFNKIASGKTNPIDEDLIEEEVDLLTRSDNYFSFIKNTTISLKNNISINLKDLSIVLDKIKKLISDELDSEKIPHPSLCVFSYPFFNALNLLLSSLHPYENDPDFTSISQLITDLTRTISKNAPIEEKEKIQISLLDNPLYTSDIKIAKIRENQLLQSISPLPSPVNPTPTPLPTSDIFDSMLMKMENDSLNNQTEDLANAIQFTKAYQLSFREDRSDSPLRYYHVTSFAAVLPIFQKNIHVSHEKKFEGAYVASQPDWGYGNYALSVNLTTLTSLSSSIARGERLPQEENSNLYLGFKQDLPVDSDLIIYNDSTVNPHELSQLQSTMKNAGFKDILYVPATTFKIFQNYLSQVTGNWTIASPILTPDILKLWSRNSEPVEKEEKQKESPVVSSQERAPKRFKMSQESKNKLQAFLNKI